MTDLRQRASLVVFPFKGERPGVIGANFEAAARHERVSEVWGVAADEGASLDQARELASEVTIAHGTTVKVFAQQRIGDYRAGKGDGMNTAVREAADAGFGRIHFYDADITNFDGRWIDGAEHAADSGYEIVRHRFPRASTDAMITWMITRPSLATLFPGTLLPRLGQPLGGELLISGAVARRLADDYFVTARSDWGIDTVITHATAAMGVPLYEHNLAEGKRHTLYGSLEELRMMVVECLDAARSLQTRPRPRESTPFASDPPAPVPDDLKQTVAYDSEASTRLLTSDWTDAEMDLARTLPSSLGRDVVMNRTEPHFEFMGAEAWGVTLAFLLEGFELGDPAWERLAFRLWLMRVLAYTTGQAASGYDTAIGYLESTIGRYEERGLRH